MKGEFRIEILTPVILTDFVNLVLKVHNNFHVDMVTNKRKSADITN